jgi:hypothetical protein
MRAIRTLGGICGATAFALLGSLPSAGATAGGNGHGHDRTDAHVLLTDLSSPKGLAVGANKDLVIGQGTFGAPGPVLSYILRGPGRGTAVPITDPFSVTDVAVSPKDGTGWAIGGDLHLYHRLADGSIVDVLDIAAYQATDPDPIDHDDPPNPTESNPYGLTVMKGGDALVADAAGDDVIRVTPDGVATTVARFDLEAVSTDHLPPDFFGPGVPIPPTFDAEPVPTTVTIGPDGAIYVGELKGFPFHPGTSNIWRIKPNATGAWCSVNTPDPTGACTLYATGFTAIQDIAFNRDNGRLYVYELAADGVFAFEAALEDPTGSTPFPPAVLLEVRKSRWSDRRTELAAGELSQPGGVVVTQGKVYVTDGVFTSGRLLQVDIRH